jgi:hypothetical protein
MFQTAQQAAEALYAAIPHRISLATLEEYGIEVTAAQAQQITQEVLSLNLFWIRCALDAVLLSKDRDRVMTELRRRILDMWTSSFGLDGVDSERYFEEAEERRKNYDQAMQEGASPVMISTETASILVADSAVQPENRQRVLALLIDLVPVDDLGVVAEQIKLTE